MSISCLRIKSSSRSSGPSYTGKLIRYGLATSLTPGGFARVVPFEYRVPHALHRAPRRRPRFRPARVEDIPNLLRMRLEFLAARLNRLDPRDQILRHHLLAIDAADRGRPAIAINLRDGLLGRK